MSNSSRPSSPDSCIEAVTQDLDLENSMRAPESESKEGVDSSFDALMEKLACKIQGEDQIVRHYAAEVEATILNILHQYPDQMDEDTVVDLKRGIFYNGLKRIYKDSFVHIYEDKKSFELILKAALTVEEALQKLPTPKKPKEYDFPNRKRLSKRKTMRVKDVWGWARTGLEPEVLVHINNTHRMIF